MCIEIRSEKSTFALPFSCRDFFAFSENTTADENKSYSAAADVDAHGDSRVSISVQRWISISLPSSESWGKYKMVRCHIGGKVV